MCSGRRLSSSEQSSAAPPAPCPPPQSRSDAAPAAGRGGNGRVRERRKLGEGARAHGAHTGMHVNTHSGQHTIHSQTLALFPNPDLTLFLRQKGERQDTQSAHQHFSQNAQRPAYMAHLIDPCPLPISQSDAAHVDLTHTKNHAQLLLRLWNGNNTLP